MTSRRRQVASRYDSAARQYRAHWAPVLANLARPFLRALPRVPGARVVDLGCGVGWITARVARAVGTEDVVGIDHSLAMLRLARAQSRVFADVVRLPLRPATADVAVSTFVLQHVVHPGRVWREAARILRPGGVFATLTWGEDEDPDVGASRLVQRVLDDAGADEDPAGAIGSSQGLVATPARVRRYARAAGFAEVEAWSERPVHRWTPARFAGQITAGGGTYGRRLGTLDPKSRERALRALDRGLAKLGPEDFAWRPEVVVGVATLPAERLAYAARRKGERSSTSSRRPG